MENSILYAKINIVVVVKSVRKTVVIIVIRIAQY